MRLASIVLMWVMIAVVILIGYGSDIEDEGIPIPKDSVQVSPPSGSPLQSDGFIRIVFDNAPKNLSVSTGEVVFMGKTVRIYGPSYGPFPPGLLTLKVTWDSGSRTLVYTVLAPDTDAPKFIGGTLTDGHGYLPSYLRLSQVRRAGRFPCMLT